MSGDILDNDDPWMAAMRGGDFASAWRISDAVLRQRQAAGIDCSTWPRHLQFIWNGQSFDGQRVLVRCYHGLGDTIQFVRLLAKLRARAAQVTLWVQPSLIELLRSVPGIDTLLPLHDGTPQVDYDLDMELMELPYALRVTERDVQVESPYITVPGGRRITKGRSMRVGIAWRAGEWDQRRSIPTPLLAPLQRLRNVRWYSLQYPDASLPFPADNLACGNIAQMAARICELDLVISVDTMMAHLAGALGVPVWTLLPHNADWRWFDHPTRTVWYPTMRLLRQPAPGAWPAIIEGVIEQLARLSAMRPRFAEHCTHSAGCTVSSG